MDLLTPQDLTTIRGAALGMGQKRRSDAAKELAGIVGVARPKLLGELDNFMQSGMDSRDFVLSRKWTIAASGGAYKDFTLQANKLKLFSDLVSSTFPSQQPTGKLFAIKKLRIVCNPKEKVLTLDELAEKWGIRMNYADGRSPFEFPACEVLNTRSRVANAGNNAGALVEGVRTELMEIGKEITFDPADVNIISPGDSNDHLEGFWLADWAGSPPTTPAGGAPAADIVVQVIATGRVFAQINRS